MSGNLTLILLRLMHGRVGSTMAVPLVDDTLVIRYEDMVADRSATARRASEWLAVELDADAVEADRNKFRHHMTTTTASESVGRWKSDLSPEESATVTDALRPAMEQLRILCVRHICRAVNFTRDGEARQPAAMAESLERSRPSERAFQLTTSCAQWAKAIMRCGQGNESLPANSKWWTELS